MSIQEDLPDNPVQTHRDHAEHIHGKLVEELETLELFDRDLKRHPNPDSHEHARGAQVFLAIGYLQQSIAALEKAARA